MINAHPAGGAIRTGMRGFGFLVLALLVLLLAPLGDGLRVPAGAVGWMELCSDAGPVQVAMAADGSVIPSDDAPDRRPTHCPDCLPLPQPVTAGGAAVVPLPAAAAPHRLHAAVIRTLPAGHDRPRPSARGPPMVT